VGDSKSLPPAFSTNLSTDLVADGYGQSNYVFDAIGGSTVASMQAQIDSWIASSVPVGGVPSYILLNLGVNDAGTTLPPEATWEANYEYILDALHTKWPYARLYLMYPGCAGDSVSNLNTLHTWINVILAARSTFAFAGPDEQVWLANGDNYTTYTIDGTHYNAAGEALAATEWKTVLGL
jgi:lysophospholipase L1-like esterase